MKKHRKCGICYTQFHSLDFIINVLQEVFYANRCNKNIITLSLRDKN